MNINAFLQKDYENEPSSGPKKTNPKQTQNKPNFKRAKMNLNGFFQLPTMGEKLGGVPATRKLFEQLYGCWPVMNNETITKPERLAFFHLNRLGSDNAWIDHPDITRVVPGRRRIVRVVDDTNANCFAVVELYRVIIPPLGGPVQLRHGVMRVG